MRSDGMIVGWIAAGFLMLAVQQGESSCSDKEYELENKCCSKCDPGTGLVSVCSAANDTACFPCVDKKTFSSSIYHDVPCRQCTDCPAQSHIATSCNRTHDTVCQCDMGFYFSLDGGDIECLVCELCPVGMGVISTCGDGMNTECLECPNGTYSDISSSIATCTPCTQCTGSQRALQSCDSTRDAICFDIPKNFPSKTMTTEPTALEAGDYEDSDEIDIIPLYCALLGAVVVGLLGYVVFTHYRRMKEKQKHKGHEPHEEVEYSKASGGDSGVYMESELTLKTYTLSTRIKDLPQMKKKELEKNLIAFKTDLPVDNWRSLARELGFNEERIASIEARAPPDSSPPVRGLLHEWSKSHKATVGKLIRALRTVGRADAAKCLQADLSEINPGNDVTSHIV
ncbi:hypothetical protein ScPMuIL_017289 [Solemya velum]